MSGTYDALHEIAAERSFPLPIRQQSLIQFKNFATNFWKSRRSAQSSRYLSSFKLTRGFTRLLSDEERSRIKARALLLLDEADNVVSYLLTRNYLSLITFNCYKIAECNELCIAKIARHDFPSNW